MYDGDDYYLTYRTYTGTWGSESNYTDAPLTTSYRLIPHGLCVSSGGTVYRVYHDGTARKENGSGTIFTGDITHGSAVIPDTGSTRYIITIDTDADVHLRVNTGSGWSSVGDLVTGTYLYVAVEWQYNNENQSGGFNYLYGNASNVYHGFYSFGTDTSDSQSAYLKGSQQASDSQQAYIAGSVDDTSSTDAYVSGILGAVDSQPAYLEGFDTATDSKSAYLLGSQDDTDSKSAYLLGSQDDTDSKSAYLLGSQDDTDSKSAYLLGAQLASASQPAYLLGKQDASDSQLAYVAGGVLDSDSKSAYVFGIASSIDAQSAYIDGKKWPLPVTEDWTGSDEDVWRLSHWASLSS
jgi:hypothetical protein